MKSKLSLSIDSDLMKEINQKAKLNKNINLSKMVERFLFDHFKSPKADKSVVTSLRGILKNEPVNLDWKEEKAQRLTNKYLND